MELERQRTLHDWMYNPTYEETICKNYFHQVMVQIHDGAECDDPLNPHSPDSNHMYTKIAKLIKADLVLLEGDAIYVREGTTLHSLGDAIDLLAYYMHVDTKEARKAADILETNFQGFFPITAQKVWRNGITIVYEDGTFKHVDLATLEEVVSPPGYPEFGQSVAKFEHFEPLMKYFSLVNTAINDPWFCEKMLMYPFNQRIREKSHVLVGEGGNGKGILMQMIGRLYGKRALCDAPQPNFSGHSAGVISYNFIGKRVVTFEDVGDPSVAMLEWLKRMITGNLEVKTPSGAWLTLPCNANFFMETNHRPQVLDIEAHKRRYILREFAPGFKLADYMTEEELDIVGDRGDISSGDLVEYLIQVKDAIDDWTEFREIELEEPGLEDF